MPTHPFLEHVRNSILKNSIRSLFMAEFGSEEGGLIGVESCQVLVKATLEASIPPDFPADLFQRGTIVTHTGEAIRKYVCRIVCKIATQEGKFEKRSLWLGVQDAHDFLSAFRETNLYLRLMADYKRLRESLERTDKEPECKELAQEWIEEAKALKATYETDITREPDEQGWEEKDRASVENIVRLYMRNRGPKGKGTSSWANYAARLRRQIQRMRELQAIHDRQREHVLRYMNRTPGKDPWQHDRIGNGWTRHDWTVEAMRRNHSGDPSACPYHRIADPSTYHHCNCRLGRIMWEMLRETHPHCFMPIGWETYFDDWSDAEIRLLNRTEVARRRPYWDPKDPEPRHIPEETLTDPMLDDGVDLSLWVMRAPPLPSLPILTADT